MSLTRYYFQLNESLCEKSENWFKERNIPLIKYKAMNSIVCALLRPEQVEQLESCPYILSGSDEVEITIDVFLNQRDIFLNRGNWGLDRIDQRSLPLDNKYSFIRMGIDVKVYIIDTGINLRHDQFRNRVTPLYDSERNSSDPNFSDDDNSHGSHVAGIVGGSDFGVANQVQLFSVKAFSSSGSTTLGKLLAAFDTCIDHKRNNPGPAVANMSFSGPQNNIMEAGVQEMIREGIICVAAAGNAGRPADQFSPAAMDDVITVGACDRGDRYAFFSNTSISSIGISNGPNNFGSAINIIAPGVDIRSAENGAPQAVGNKSGTSMAAPFVAGVCALHLEENPSLTQKEMMDKLIKDSTKNVIELTEDAIATGTPNRLLYINIIGSNIGWVTSPGILATGREGNPFFAEVVANSTDQEGNSLPISYSIIDGKLPSQLSMNNKGEIRGVLPDVNQDEDFVFTVEANDGRGTTIQNFIIRVLNINVAPIWDSRVNSDLRLVYGTFAPNTEVFIDFLDFQDQVDQNKRYPAATDEDGDILSFVVTQGVLPDDLQLTIDGKIQGRVSSTIFEDIEESFRVFEFTVRVSDGLQFKDKDFRLTIERNEETNLAPIWTTLDFTRGPLGVFEQTSIINLFVTAEDPEQDTVTYKIDDTNFPPVGVPPLSNPDTTISFDFVTESVVPPRTTYKQIGPEEFGTYYGLPSGLELLSNGRLKGQIDCNAPMGEYYFQISASDGITSSLRTFYLIISPIGTGLSTIIEEVVWETPEGSLGSIEETYPSWFGVVARSTTESLVEYTLAPLSRPLPPGMFVDKTTGQIRGQVQYVDKDRIFKFKIRASIVGKPEIYKDREFEIYVVDIFQEPINEMSFVITGDDKIEYFKWHLDDSILGDQFIYRNGDPNFGRITFPKMHIISGFSQLSPSEFYSILNFIEPDRPLSTYHQKLAVTLGELKWAKTTDLTGKHIYDVLYYEVIDPHRFVGGFDENNQVQTIEYPQIGINTQGIRFVYPKSLNNWRSNVIDRVNFVKFERLPLWMRSEQVDGDASSILGFVPSITVAYLQAGTGSIVVNQLIDNMEFRNQFMHRIYLIDRYLVEDFTRIIKKTEFDKTEVSETIFDDGFTVFDAIEEKGQKRYYKFPPGDIFGSSEKV